LKLKGIDGGPHKRWSTWFNSMLEKTKKLCRWREAGHYSYLIEMDGGIGASNAAEAARGGCDVLVMGSAVFGAADPAVFLQETKLKVKEAVSNA
jgi:ribulose-phosphate 3-epimerase